MSQFAFGYGFTLFTALIVIVSDFVIKIAADAWYMITSRYVLMGMLLYGASALCWFYAMQHVTLAQARVAYSMLTLIALAIIVAVSIDDALRARKFAAHKKKTRPN